jgi:hypothetical protein
MCSRPASDGLHRQSRGGDGHQVMMRRKVLGRGVGGEERQPVRIGEGGSVADLDGQDAGQKLRRFRKEEREPMERRVPLPQGLQRALHRCHEITRGSARSESHVASASGGITIRARSPS